MGATTATRRPESRSRATKDSKKLASNGMLSAYTQNVPNIVLQSQQQSLAWRAMPQLVDGKVLMLGEAIAAHHQRCASVCRRAGVMPLRIQARVWLSLCGARQFACVVPTSILMR